MHIPATTSETISPTRLLRQLRETSTEQVPEAVASVAVSLSPDARLASLVDRLLAGDGRGIDAAQVVRLLGQSALFDTSATEPGVPLPLAGLVDPATGDSLSLQALGREGFDAGRLAELLRNVPDVLPLVQASLASAGLDTLFSAAANDTRALPPAIRLYLDNGGVPGIRLEPPETPVITPQVPLP